MPPHQSQQSFPAIRRSVKTIVKTSRRDSARLTASPSPPESQPANQSRSCEPHRKMQPIDKAAQDAEQPPPATHHPERIVLFQTVVSKQDMKRYVIYLRVSSQDQGRSGLGLEAQQRDVDLFLSHYEEKPYEIIHTFIEIQSGRDDSRPQLEQAIKLAKQQHAVLVVSKLDRLSRRVSFVAKLMEDRHLEFKVAQMPHADKFQLHIYACLAEQERDFISQRTKAALEIAKARGKQLGAPKIHLRNLAEARSKRADAAAQRVASVIKPLRQQGKPLREICIALNKAGLKTERGKDFHPSLVSRMLKRLNA
jgi:DNA invertase Pin-like site-specific DNA recombinase